MYDDNSGVYAGRLWWMLRWLGHDAVAVLDGDWRAWQREGRPTRAGVETRPPRTFVAHVRPELVVTAAEIEARLATPRCTCTTRAAPIASAARTRRLIRSPATFPAPVLPPTSATWMPTGECCRRKRCAPASQELLGDTPAEEAIFYCGSGVSVAHDVLAVQHAGLGMPRVYVGSWSDWISNGQRPVER